MMKTVKLRGVTAKVQFVKSRAFPLALLLSASAFFAACGEAGPAAPGAVNPNDTAATVNGKAIKMEEVERAVKQQAQGQESRLSPLELAAARLQVLQSLIEQEVMFQKAEKEGTVPTDDEVTVEFNKRKTASGLSAEKFDEEMKKIGENEASARLSIKRGLAIQKLNEKITNKIEPPKDSEIELFYSSNREAFKRKRGVQLAAIVFDPRDLGEGDLTKNDLEAQTKARETGARLLQGADFATVARELSEDQDTRFKGGDWQYFTEEQMKQVFPQGFAEAVMALNNGDIVRNIVPFEGRYLLLKVQQKVLTDEDRTLDSPGVRQDITENLSSSRKQLLAASYQTTAMNEARIENFLAKKVVENPNELSGARPAGAANTSNTVSNTAMPSTSNSNVSNTDSASNVAASTNANRQAATNARANSNR